MYLYTSAQGVVDMLEKLHDKFEDERTDLEKEESNARHAYEMLIQVTRESCFRFCNFGDSFGSSVDAVEVDVEIALITSKRLRRSDPEDPSG